MRDLSRPLNSTSQGFARIMAVFGAVAKDGPLTLERVCQLTQIPRSACWRCLTTLEAEGWLCRRLLDGAFQPTNAARRQVGAPAPLPDFVETIAATLPDLLRGKRASADIAVLASHDSFDSLDAGGVLHIVDTTRKAMPAPEPLFASPLALAALSVTPSEDRLALVRRAMEEASAEERRDVTAGRFTRALSQAAATGDIWDSADGTLTFAVDGGSGAKGALRLEAQGSTKRSENRLRGIGLNIRYALRDLLPEPADVVARYWPALSREMR